MQLITTLRTTTRPSTDILFYQWPDSFISYTEENFVKTNRLIGYKISLSDDLLTETRYAVWANFASYQDFVNSVDGASIWSAREEYQNQNNISSAIQTTALRVDSLDEISSSLTVNLRN
jgi:hypothetical protein